MEYEDSIFTEAVHAGEDLSQNFGAISTPIFQSSIFAFSDADTGAAIHSNEQPGFYYSRLGNPTSEALERAVCELERGESALTFASGMAAITSTILTLVKSGDHIVSPQSIYTTTSKFLDFLAANFGVEVTYVDQANPENYAAAVKSNTRVFYLESPANPTLKLTDIAAVVAIARAKGIETVFDNTFATPFNQRPLDYGITAVVHSATKYFGGHSDLTAGLLTGKKEIVEKARHASLLFGGNIAPQVAWLVLRGIKTLALRMERHNQNAFAVANMLMQHPKIEAVYYPGLPTHPQHELAKRQMKRGFGGMVAFDVGNREAAKKLMNNLKLCTLATSLGGVETLIQHPASMTNASTPREERLQAGITDGLIRLSVGIENADDLIADFEQALREI